MKMIIIIQKRRIYPQMNRIIKTIYTLLAFSAIVVGCTKEADVFTREQDNLTLSCIEQTIQQNILCSGEWTTYSDSEWLTVSPERGVGNGKDYQFYNIHVEYNSGADRSGVIIFTHNGKEYEVEVNQKACDFAIGDATFDGILIKDAASTAKIKIAYFNASGSESVKITATVSGEAAAGLTVKSMVFESFNKGDGFIEIPVTGPPSATGTVKFSIKIDNLPAKVIETVVSGQSAGQPEGFPVGWNFWDAGITSPGSSEQGMEWKAEPHKIYPTHGNNEGAFLSAVSSQAATYGFNSQSIMMTGFLGGDYVIATIPVKNISTSTRITVEGATGGAKGSIGFWVLEYSSDAQNWMMADGAVAVVRSGVAAIDPSGNPIIAHFWNTYASINANGTVCKDGSIGCRASYDKTNPYETYHKYTFALKNVNIVEGNLYLRLRALEWGATQDAVKKAGSGNTDIKGFEISLDE